MVSTGALAKGFFTAAMMCLSAVSVYLVVKHYQRSLDKKNTEEDQSSGKGEGNVK